MHHFSVCDFVHTNEVREITLSIDGEPVTIRAAKISDEDVAIEGHPPGGMWFVQAGALGAVLGRRHRIFYEMFLGVLLTALHKNNTQLPTRDISWDEVDRAGEASQLQSLADSIARGEMSQPIPDTIAYPEVVRGWWAEARFHPDFYCVFTQSGFRGGTHIDEKGRELYLPPDASDEALGGVVLEAMAASRWLLPKPMPGDFDHPEVEFDDETSDYLKAFEREMEWDRRTRKRYQLKYKKDVYAPMKRCNIARKEGEITIKCRVHYPESQGGNSWGFDTNELAPYVILPDTATAEEIGAGVKLAFSRCRDLPG